jgi:uncharacterized protein
VQIEGSRVLLTGATGGLGQAIAKELSARGAHLLLTGRNEEILVTLADEVGGEPFPADLGRRDHVTELPGRAGRVDIFVHNAGLPGSGAFTDLTLEEIERVLDVNLRAALVLTHALLPAMLERGSGHLVYMSSMAGMVPLVLAAPYSATKFGLRGFAGGLRDELHGTGVGVSAIFPGPIDEAGMQAVAGVRPPAPRRRYPRHVAGAVVRGIERNKGEIAVADPIQRFGAVTAALTPGIAARMRRLVPLRDIVAASAKGQREAGKF